jgi:uroporphyrinogen-III synthase
VAQPRFDGLSVLVLESRRAKELASIVESYGGRPIIAPSMREIPLESNTEALAFADAVIRLEFDLIVLLTGVGTRALLELVDTVRAQRDPFIAALERIPIAARGPKPTRFCAKSAHPWLQAPEPNTWRELIAALDQRASRCRCAPGAWRCRNTAPRTPSCCRRSTSAARCSRACRSTSGRSRRSGAAAAGVPVAG